MAVKMDAKKKKVIDVLNKARAMELGAISQYMDQHYLLDDLDYGRLAKKIKKIAIDEMRHAEKLAERVKELDGMPTHEHLGGMKKSQTVNDVYPIAVAMEDDTIEKYNDFMNVCRDCGDNVSAELFKKLLLEEQDHYNYFDDEERHIKTLGNAYLAELAGSGEAD
ncbi:MAG: bacterioferritin [Deltaproteobacteria bacterium]|jgi:bacterioferritin|nr:bacterioferritin [Deltaproteobacteria bacterium]